LQRAGRVADGWIAQFSVDDLSEDTIRTGVGTMNDAAPAKKSFRVVVRVTGADRRLDQLVPRLGAIAAAGGTDVVVDIDWSTDDGAERAAESLRAAVA
jgi:hypothetical protein